MKFLFKVIIVFLIIFNFRLPMVYDSVVVAIIVTALYYLFGGQSISLTYFSRRYVVTILIATFLLLILIVFITVMHQVYWFLMAKRVVLVFFMLSALIFALPILIEDESTAFRDAVLVICSAFAIQGFIHTLGFLIAPVGDWLFNFQTERIKEMMLDPSRNIDRFRAYSLTGSPFFELPAAYGVACILFFRLQLGKDKGFLTGWRSYVIMFFLVMGIMLSGRTGFVGFFIGLFLYIFFTWRDSVIFKNIWKIFGVFILLVILFYAGLTSKQRESFIDDLFPFAFEAYYNWRDTGKFDTGSSDALVEGHYFTIPSETLLWGEGGDSGAVSGFGHTDAGYMNNLIFGGMFYLVFLIICQSFYILPPMRLAGAYASRQKRIDFYCFLFLFAYMFILEAKAPTLGTQHITMVLLLYAGITYIVEYDAWEEAGAIDEEYG